MAKTGPENSVDSREFSLESIFSRLPPKTQLTLSYLFNEVSSWLPRLKPKDIWRPLIAGILPLQMAACKPTRGFEYQTPPSPTPIVEPYRPTLPPTETPLPPPTLTPTVVPGPFEGQPAILYPSDEMIKELGITDYKVVDNQLVALQTIIDPQADKIVEELREYLGSDILQAIIDQHTHRYIVARAITNKEGEFIGWQRTLPFDAESGLVVPHPQETNPELFDITNPDSPIVQFANAFGVKPEEVGNLTPKLLTGVDGKQFVVLTTGDLAATDNYDESGTPLIIAEQGENGEWVWRSINANDKPRIAGTTLVGIAIDEYDNYRNPLYRKNVVENAMVIFPTGAFMPSYIESRGKAPANSFIDLVLSYPNQHKILYLHPGLWNNNKPKELQNSPSNEVTLNYMKEKAKADLEIIKKIASSGGITYVNYVNEPWWADPPNKPVNVGWIESPYFKVYGNQLLVEQYMTYHKQAELLNSLANNNEPHLEIGNQFRMIISVDGIFFPSKKLDFVLDQIIIAKKTIASKLGIPADQVQLDLAMQWRFDKNVTGPKMSDEGRYKLPTKDELKMALQKIKETADKNGLSIPVHITEFELVGMSPEERQILMEEFTQIAEENGVMSITYNGVLGSPNNPYNNQNRWFNGGGQPTTFYFRFIKSQWRSLLGE